MGGAPRFNNPNYDPSWGPPPMYGPPPGYAGQELWVETKTDDGKSYYYHAMTRETTWTRPEGPHIRIMTQGEVEAMSAAKNQQPPTQQQMSHQQPTGQLPHQTNAVAANNSSDHAMDEGAAAVGTETSNGESNGAAASDESNPGTKASTNNETSNADMKTLPAAHQAPPSHAPPAQQQPPQMMPPGQMPPGQMPPQMAPQFSSPPPFQYGMFE